MHVFLLGIESRQERMATTAARLREKGFEPEPFYGIDGAQANAHEKVCATAGAWRELTIGQLCCAQSHINVYSEILNRGLERAVIIEDDALPHVGAKHLEERLDSLPKGWHIALLLTNDLCAGIVNPDSKKHTGHWWRMNEVSYGAWAYAVSAEGAKYFYEESSPIFTPIDCVFRFRSDQLGAYQTKVNWFSHDHSLHSAIYGMERPVAVHEVALHKPRVDFVCPAPATHLRIIVPFRNRFQHLPALVRALNSTLAAQNIKHQITVVEQEGNDLFNRGKLCNVGFKLHENDDAWFAFHDVDLLPESPNCDYGKPPFPTHVSVYNSQANYAQTYESAMGGVTLWPREWFRAVNGYSNEYRGWGIEDDDLRKRMSTFGVPSLRRYGRFRSLHHAPKSSKPFVGRPEERAALVADTSPFWLDNYRRFEKGYDYGMDGLSTLQFEVTSTQEIHGCEFVTVKV